MSRGLQRGNTGMRPISSATCWLQRYLELLSRSRIASARRALRLCRRELTNSHVAANGRQVPIAGFGDLFSIGGSVGEAGRPNKACRQNARPRNQ